MAGLVLQLPEKHLAVETKEVVRLGTGLVATIAALVLGLMISSAQSRFDSVNDELLENSARVLMLDRALSEYGPEAQDARALVRKSYERRIRMLFSGRAREEARAEEGRRAVAHEESLDGKLAALAPHSPAQQALQSRAQELTGEIELTRALMHVQSEEGLPPVLLVVLVVWLAVIFVTFGLFAPRNATVVITLLVCAMSAAGAIFLILELNTPFDGVITVSSVPLEETLRRLGR